MKKNLWIMKKKKYFEKNIKNNYGILKKNYGVTNPLLAFCRKEKRNKLLDKCLPHQLMK